VVRSPSIPSIAALGFLLLAIFAAWIAAAQLLCAMLLDPTPPTSLVDFLSDVVSTECGWMLIRFGCFIGFCFAAVTRAVSGSTWHLYRKVIIRDPAEEHPIEWANERIGESDHDRCSPSSFLFPLREE
jgi:uncharacterized membrane protein